MTGYIISGAVLVLLAVILIRAALFVEKKQNTEKFDGNDTNDKKALEHLSEAIKIDTTSVENLDNNADFSNFYEFHEFLERTYPLIHKTMKKEVIAEASLLYYWEGKNPDLKPIAMLSHMDVVPVEKGTENDWKYPAFSGYNDGENLWGRGSLDMKHHLIALTEAVEALIEEGFVPDRGIYLCFGQDEELSICENRGAAKIAQTLNDRNVELEAVLDEGGSIMPVNFAGINASFAAVGTTEKGFADFKVTVFGKGGHASTPPKHTAVGTLAKVIRKIENHPMKAKLLPVNKELLEKAGRNMPFYIRIFLANLWLFKPLLLSVMKKIPEAASVIRTTQAITMCSASEVSNVLPQKASVVINCRLLPGDTTEDVLNHLKKIVGKDGEVEFIGFKKEAAPISSTKSKAYLTVEKICKEITDNSVTIPLLVMGATDSFYYEGIADTILRISPFPTPMNIMSLIHNTNEHLPIESMKGAVYFFKSYIKTMTKN